jgi:hypothetical protein
VTDVAGEPDWRRYAAYEEWTDDEGCLIRIDVLAERPGPAHCGWDGADVIIMGAPLGSNYTSPTDTVEYVRDPKGVFGRPEFVTGFEVEPNPPPAAEDTGFRRGSAELWVQPDDAAVVWVVEGSGRAERWPRGPTPVCS